MARRTTRRVTIHDVAREAGVAASTVSRAFSDPRRLSQETREHVADVAERMGYRPNPIARALPRGKTLMLALLVSDITNPYFFGLIRGAEQQAAASGYTLVLTDTGESPDTERAHFERLIRGVDGFVFASSRLSDERIRALVSGHTVVLVNRTVRELPCVVVDNGQGMRYGVDHLASLGHRSVAYLAGPSVSWSDRVQWRALQSAGRRLGFSMQRLGPFRPTVDGGVAAADAAIVTGATAIVAFNDLLAIGVLRRLHDRGIAVPADVSVLGSDDIFGADFCHPRLTTLRSDTERAGRAAVGLLLAALAQPGAAAATRIVLPTELRVRESTGPAPVTS